ncbi:hypothetical protein ES703_95901 [subsurface metagenome]
MKKTVGLLEVLSFFDVSQKLSNAIIDIFRVLKVLVCLGLQGADHVHIIYPEPGIRAQSVRAGILKFSVGKKLC